MFDEPFWANLPFHYWTGAFFILGCAVGSFLNVCIHRMPLGKSLISPPSHCPHCEYRIPWHLNVPILTWLALRGKCANCGAPISVRYLFVELLTGLVFAATWLFVGNTANLFTTLLLAAAYCVLFSGFIAATFIDIQHFIIPDEITLGGVAVGFVLSFLAPALHGTESRAEALKFSFLGILIGGGIVYAILQIGKLMFGRQNFELPPDSRVVFTETTLNLPDKEGIPYEEIFSRKSDVITCEAERIELPDRCYPSGTVRLSPEKLTVNDDVFNPEEVPRMELTTSQIVVPREAMGLGDVKFMAAIGAFLGWPATIFSLMISSLIGASVGVALILMNRREWSSKIPYGPYIALAAMLWVFGGKDLTLRWLMGGL